MPTDLEAREPLPRLDNQAPELFGQTPSQTVGPYFHYGLPWKGGADLIGNSDLGARADLFPEEHYLLGRSSVKATPKGEWIDLCGKVLDGNGCGVADAMIEIWQANAEGRYCSRVDVRALPTLDPAFIGFGRSATSPTGEFRFRTIRPGRVPGPGGGLQAPHIAMSVLGRGLLKRLVTRVYFAGEASNQSDPVLALVPNDRQSTLMARHVSEDVWRFDVVLQGAGETVFFKI